ncbi:MAG: response regulator [Bdellovibrionales bacterium]
MANQLKSESAHILVIEDEESLRYMLETKLNQEGYKVTVAATGKHGLQKIRSGKQFDLIICDLKMPMMSGLEVFREYQGMGGKSPFVILTGHPDKSKIIEAIQMGVRDVILKPIKHLELLDRVKGFLVAAPAASSQAA